MIYEQTSQIWIILWIRNQVTWATSPSLTLTLVDASGLVFWTHLWWVPWQKSLPWNLCILVSWKQKPLPMFLEFTGNIVVTGSIKCRSVLLIFLHKSAIMMVLFLSQGTEGTLSFHTAPYWTLHTALKRLHGALVFLDLSVMPQSVFTV